MVSVESKNPTDMADTAQVILQRAPRTTQIVSSTKSANSTVTTRSFLLVSQTWSTCWSLGSRGARKLRSREGQRHQTRSCRLIHVGCKVNHGTPLYRSFSRNSSIMFARRGRWTPLSSLEMPRELAEKSLPLTAKHVPVGSLMAVSVA